MTESEGLGVGGSDRLGKTCVGRLGVDEVSESGVRRKGRRKWMRDETSD